MVLGEEGAEEVAELEGDMNSRNPLLLFDLFGDLE